MNTYIAQLLLLLFTIHIYSCCDPCSDTDCYNGGICNEGVCDCPEGFEGANCEIEQSTVKKLLKKREHNDGRIDNYNYDNTGILSDYYYLSTDLTKTYKFTYSFDTDTMSIVYTLNDSPLHIKKYFLVNEETYHVQEYRYKPDGSLELKEMSRYKFERPCGITEFTKISEGMEYSVFYEYDQGSCNYKRTNNDIYGIDEFYAEVKVDSKKNPLPNPWFDYLEIQERNIVSSIFYYLLVDPNMQNPTQDTVNIIYNKYDYPVSKTRTFLTGELDQYTYTYY